MQKLFIAFLCLTFAISATAEDRVIHTFTKKHLTPNFWAEGAHAGDFDHDGKMDIVYGPFWFEGPDFVKRHQIYPATKSFTVKKEGGTEETIPGFEGALSGKNAYSDNFLTYTHDLNADGWIDVIVYGFPGAPCHWYENPQGKDGHWKKHKLIDVLDNESPMWADINGDGKPDIICGTTEKVEGVPRGFLGYATVNWSDPTQPATFHKISPPGGWGKFQHGIGIGDVNGDGRQDLLLANGWWEQPASLANDPIWQFHPTNFGSGGAQMYVYDVNGDGLNDVITSIQAHGYGLAWYEQVRETNSDGKVSDPKFTQHLIINKEPKDNKYGVKFSQPHSIDFVDMDVYHGGIGTLAQTIKAGIPHLVVPNGHDQFDNAWRIEQLGLGRSIPQTRYRSHRVGETIRAIFGSGEGRARCRDYASRMDSDAAVTRACELIEGLSP